MTIKYSKFKKLRNGPTGEKTTDILQTQNDTSSLFYFFKKYDLIPNNIEVITLSEIKVYFEQKFTS